MEKGQALNGRDKTKQNGIRQSKEELEQKPCRRVLKWSVWAYRSQAAIDDQLVTNNIIIHTDRTEA